MREIRDMPAGATRTNKTPVMEQTLRVFAPDHRSSDDGRYAAGDLTVRLQKELIANNLSRL
jgi:hypothetical protein